MTPPTQEHYGELSHAYDFFNERLFGGALPGCLFTLQRNSRSMGYFSHERFVKRDNIRTDEIALNPEYFATRPVEDVLSTLAHEQVHQWQQHFGTPPRRGYHDQEFAAKMQAVGLMPSHTGTPGGKTTGEKMSHYILPDGLFIRACKELLQSSFGIVWYDRFPVQTAKEYEFAADTTVRISPISVPSPAQAENAPEETLEMEASQAYAPGSDAGVESAVPLYSAPPIESGLDVERPATAGAAKKANTSNRTKYVCGCKTAIWAKSGIKVRCEACNGLFVAAA
ncbi:SprT-like domain-containing protein [Noviherbaspirillum pedocola]|nr:SprT-like domain-containing protein [Noviherbaspirillum pedocola]